METRLDRIMAAIDRLEKSSLPATKWRLDTAKTGIGFPRLYVPVKYRGQVRKILTGPSVYCRGYIYG